MKKNIGIISLFIGVIFFMACKENKSTVTTDHEMLSTPGMSFEGDFHTTLPSGLSIDAYELQDAPNIEPVTFDPVSDYSQRELLSIHENERKLKFSNNTLFDEMGLSMKAQCDNFTLLARHKAIPNENSIPGSTNTMFIEVLLDAKVIYTADTGDASPIVPLQGLWCYDRNWVLEYADITLTLDDETNSVRYDAVGHLVENGILINEQNSFDEIFGFQLLRGKPFYFFDKNGLIGVSFDEQATVLGYEEIPHFGCCSASLLNPDQAQNMVTFFARKDGIWYYVEIGVYE